MGCGGRRAGCGVVDSCNGHCLRQETARCTTHKQDETGHELHKHSKPCCATYPKCATCSSVAMRSAGSSIASMFTLPGYVR